MRLRLDSLQSRIVIFHLLAIAITAMLVPLANYLVISRSTNQFEARTLRAHASTISQYLSAAPDGSWRLDLPSDIRTLYIHGLDGLSYAVVDARNRPLFSSSRNSDASLIPLSAQSLTRLSRKSAILYGLVLARHGDSSTAWIKVAQNIQHPDVIFDDIISDYLDHIGWLTMAILTLLLVIDILVIRNALAPVLRSSEIASAVDPSRADLRLPVKGVPRELLPLIIAMNRALDRLERGIQLQREFTADAAHELRTPLAVLRARVETLPDQSALATVKTDIAVMSHVVTQLLEFAEVEGARINPTARVDLCAVCTDVISMLAGIAIAQDKEIALIGSEDPIWIHGDEAMIFRAARNLVDNAIKHTPRHTAVELEVTPDGGVRVMDRGLGVPEADRDFIFRRFWRADRNPTEGTGLGLAIVARITEIHSALLTVSDRPDGGAVFTLKFELAKKTNVH